MSLGVVVGGGSGDLLALLGGLRPHAERPTLPGSLRDLPCDYGPYQLIYRCFFIIVKVLTRRVLRREGSFSCERSDSALESEEVIALAASCGASVEWSAGGGGGSGSPRGCRGNIGLLQHNSPMRGSLKQHYPPPPPNTRRSSRRRGCCDCDGLLFPP